VATPLSRIRLHFRQQRDYLIIIRGAHMASEARNIVRSSVFPSRPGICLLCCRRSFDEPYLWP
jgi:hypothetical protein